MKEENIIVQTIGYITESDCFSHILHLHQERLVNRTRMTITLDMGSDFQEQRAGSGTTIGKSGLPVCESQGKTKSCETALD